MVGMVHTLLDAATSEAGLIALVLVVVVAIVGVFTRGQ